MGVMTPNEAARETRKRIKRGFNRLAANVREENPSYVYLPDFDDFVSSVNKFIDTMDDRQNAKKGGLGVKVAKSKG